ncbi:TIGR03842 family LLM class F420-dependent oxidoreductase [Brevibacterium jeotgali]|uniref:F420-dependent oxidoreductase, CPS_4043 family n=1 Tax=Brevibacterium jeotgali TaxID=1262550 RepID=A0A2H1L5E3_9MICO|nr:TIGR03842 family LLM class F420-dependent oxidoreductase [Brevibacterium jeotgali]TWC01425.1 putative F420-dependent oxidoreductase [Brevibacterium jeotgali]SMY11970.1 F420-dependent oxidoreductase, CPS_4043 family [Brevibacterium jeotgali]
MDFGVVIQANPPAARTVSLAKKAEEHKFSHFWTYDSHILWQEPYVLYSLILDQTKRITVGPMVTNPATRDLTVTASTYATLNHHFGNRTICGIGRGDSSLRVMNKKPVTLREFRESIGIIRELSNSRSVSINDAEIRLPWSEDSELDVWVAAYGPKALAIAGETGDGFILQCGDIEITEWMIRTVREAAAAAGRDPDEVDICVAAPFYVTDGSEEQYRHAIDQCRWFGGMVGNHVADIVKRYGSDGTVPRALTDYIEGREGYDYNDHGRSGNSHVDFVPDEIVERFCVIGTPEQHEEKLREYEKLGVTQFAGYLDHDNKEETLRVYGERLIPAFTKRVQAKS